MANTPNCDLFTKLTLTDSCQKCTAYDHESVGVDTPIFQKMQKWFLNQSGILLELPTRPKTRVNSLIMGTTFG